MSTFNIGQLAKRAGVPIDTMRYYERSQLLAPAGRLESGYRRYGDAELKRLHFIGGFPVDEALRFTASLEQGNEHPLADAIVGEARRRGLILSLATDFESATGCAMRPDVNGTGRMR